MRDGLSLLDRLISTGVEPLSAGLLEEFLGCPNSEKVYNLIDRIGDSDAASTLGAVEELLTTGLSEVQIADSLIDYMRDMMVLKSTGADSELVILTAEQRERLGRLAEKFDVAGLVYNITALEKLRWTIKNSDTARALLDALMLRFALSEHFLNVDSLLGQSEMGIKKNSIAGRSEVGGRNTGKVPASKEKTGNLPLLDGLGSIRRNWQGFLKIVGGKLGNGTAGLLSSAAPSRFEGGLLTLTFPIGSKVQKKMCEGNGRIEQIQSLLSEHCGQPITIKLEAGAEADAEGQAGLEQPISKGTRRSELINDPAVKTVLMELNAMITGIEEE